MLLASDGARPVLSQGLYGEDPAAGFLGLNNPLLGAHSLLGPAPGEGRRLGSFISAAGGEVEQQNHVWGWGCAPRAARAGGEAKAACLLESTAPTCY